VGKGVMAADGDSHKRQRKNISPGFTTVKIREYTSTFYDCAHKVRFFSLMQYLMNGPDT
jgi:cytochrome P450